MIWVSSDIHLNHQNILMFTDRHKHWSSIEDMNHGIIENINKCVDENDTIYFLGDVCMGLLEETLPLLDSIVCKDRRLILGNHDRPWPGNKNAFKWWDHYAQYFTWMGGRKLLNLNGEKVEFSHFPFSGDSHMEERFEKWRPEDNGQWLCHGHIHSRSISEVERCIHAGIDADWTEYDVPKYHPIPLTTIQQYIKDHT